MAELPLPESSARRRSWRARCIPFIEKRGYQMPGDEAWLEKMVATLRERAKTLVELVDFAHFYLSDDIEIDPKAAAKFLKPEIAEPLKALAAGLARSTGGIAAEARCRRYSSECWRASS